MTLALHALVAETSCLQVRTRWKETTPTGSLDMAMSATVTCPKALRLRLSRREKATDISPRTINPHTISPRMDSLTTSLPMTNRPTNNLMINHRTTNPLMISHLLVLGVDSWVVVVGAAVSMDSKIRHSTLARLARLQNTALLLTTSQASKTLACQVFPCKIKAMGKLSRHVAP